MRRIAIVILACSSLMLAAPPPEAPPPKLIEIYRAYSDPKLPPVPSGFSWRVVFFAFSPDEQWIAVMLHPSPTQKGGIPVADNTLLLLPLHAGNARVQIDPGTPVAALWSRDSESVVVQANLGRRAGPPKIYNLRGELVWTGPQSEGVLGFIQPGRLLARQAKAHGRSAGFDTIDIRTSAVTPWHSPRHGDLAAIDSERGLLAMFPDSEGSKTLIVDSAAGKVVQSVKNQNQTSLEDFGQIVERGPGDSIGCDYEAGCPPFFTTFVPPRVYFAENGKTLCQTAVVGSFRSHPVCQDVDTGKTIAEFRGFDGGAPASASTRGSRMVLTKLNSLPSHWGGLGGGLGVETYSRRVVWDFRAGTEVAAWTPSTQQTGWLAFGVANGRSAPAVAISSFGNYVAEAVGDELHVYRLP